MKLNFWQWLGVVLLIIGVVAWIVERRAETPTAPPNTVPAATAPAAGS